jgi:hypothetical protein
MNFFYFEFTLDFEKKFEPPKYVFKLVLMFSHLGHGKKNSYFCCPKEAVKRTTKKTLCWLKVVIDVFFGLWQVWDFHRPVSMCPWYNGLHRHRNRLFRLSCGVGLLWISGNGLDQAG